MRSWSDWNAVTGKDYTRLLWDARPHPRFGTTYRLIDAITLLQMLTILASRGDVYLLGEAYAFGVVWSFFLKSLGVLVLRFRRKDQEYKHPGNLHVGGVEIPLGPRPPQADAAAAKLIEGHGGPLDHHCLALQELFRRELLLLRQMQKRLGRQVHAGLDRKDARPGEPLAILQRAQPLILRTIRMNRAGLDSAGFEPPRDLVRAVFGSTKDQDSIELRIT